MREFYPPVLDLALLSSEGEPDTSSPEWATVAGEFDAAMRTNGVVYVRNCGVTPGLIESVRTASRSYFLSPEPKPAAEQYGKEGYSSIGTEMVQNSLTTPGDRDVVESLQLYSATSDLCPPELLAPLGELFPASLRLTQVLLRMMAWALGAPADVLLGPRGEPFIKLKLSHYPVTAGTQGYGAHKDFGGFTLLAQEFGPAFPAEGALELYVDDEWFVVPPLQDAILINAGELIERWTNNLYKAPLHRVILAEQRTVPRFSIIFFTAPHSDETVAPLEQCYDDEASKYEPVVVGDWMARKFRLTNA